MILRFFVSVTSRANVLRTQNTRDDQLHLLKNLLGNTESDGTSTKCFLLLGDTV